MFIIFFRSVPWGQGFFWLSFCDHEIVKNNKSEHLWSSHSRKGVIFLQEV